MRHIDDLQITKWLTDHINWSTASHPLLLKNFLPASFDNYLAILWVPGIIDDFPFSDVAVPPETIQQINKNIQIWKSFNVLNDTRDDVYRATDFTEISEIFDLPYNRNIIYNLPWETRGLTTLLSKTEILLENLVTRLSNNSQLYIFVEDYYRWVHVDILPVDKEVTYIMTANDFMQFVNDTGYDATSYLFPDDKSWCLCNLEDLDFFVLAFNNKHSEAISSLYLPDTFILTPDDRLFD